MAPTALLSALAAPTVLQIPPAETLSHLEGEDESDANDESVQRGHLDTELDSESDLDSEW